MDRHWTYLVSGSSTGIGRATALALAERGAFVLAGVRRLEHAPEHPRVIPVLLDVGNRDHAEALATRLAGERLHGLVNNAGIVVSGPLEGLSAEDWRRQLEVNVVGLATVTRVALPALRAARGRIVNVGSIGGAVPPPFVGPYAASKGAVRALSASMRRELLPLGVAVSLVEPGAVATPIWSKGLEASATRLAALPPDLARVYGSRLERFTAATERTAARAIAPEDAAAAIVSALTARRPPAQVFVGREARVSALLQRLLPAGAFDRLVVRRAGGAVGLPPTGETHGTDDDIVRARDGGDGRWPS
ncbi:MAG: SDR family NAD(P)-dependent oxidoreductase [Solirubrobacterales bacterium]|nr:SDR family NAD(P)-dependent oxidoreductase [Solirubrobacterales bacterium]